MTEILKNEDPHPEIIVSDSITLRQLQVDEADAIFDLVDSDREYLGRFLPWVETTVHVNDSREFIIQTLQKRKEGSEYGYGVIFDGAVVGHMSLMHTNDGEEPEIGYWITNKMSGQGISTKACGALADFGFTQLGLKKIIIKADPQNIGSNRIAEKLGAVLERQEHDPRVGAEKANVWALHKQ